MPVDVVDLLEDVVHVPHLHRPVDRGRHHRVPRAHGQRLNVVIGSGDFVYIW